MIKKILNGEAKAVSHIVKKSYNLFNADVFSSVSNPAISYGRKAQTVTVTNSYYTALGLTLGQFAPSLKAGSTYTLYFETTAGNKFIWVRFPGTGGYMWNIGKARTLTEDDLKSFIYVYGEVGKTHTLSKFQIVEGAETKPYVPYLLDVAKVKKVIDGTAVDVFTRVISEVADGVAELNPAEVADGLLTIKGDNVKVENNKLIIL